MAPGGSSCKEVIESHPSISDYDIAAAKAESNSTPAKGIISLGGKHGVYSNNGVHKLLECPVCTNLMYPPIHQVCIGMLYVCLPLVIFARFAQHILLSALTFILDSLFLIFVGTFSF